MTLAAMRSAPQPSALFASNNFIAIGALHALDELSLRVPEDIAVVGMDDLPEAMVTFPFLTVVAQPAFEMAARAHHAPRRPRESRAPTSGGRPSHEARPAAIERRPGRRPHERISTSQLINRQQPGTKNPGSRPPSGPSQPLEVVERRDASEAVSSERRSVASLGRRVLVELAVERAACRTAPCSPRTRQGSAGPRPGQDAHSDQEAAVIVDEADIGPRTGPRCGQTSARSRGARSRVGPRCGPFVAGHRRLVLLSGLETTDPAHRDLSGRPRGQCVGRRR